MPTPVVKAIKLLKNAASLIDFPPPAQCSEFKRYNLIYGFNGSGKTTLSRLFEALRHEGFRGNLPEGCQCVVTLSDGSEVSFDTPTSTSAVAEKIAVFNEDFIENALTWKGGAAQPIVYIGKEQADVAATIEAIEGDLVSQRADELLKSAEWSAASKALSTLKTDTARLISNEIGQKNYDARHLKSDYDKRAYDKSETLHEKAIAELKSVIATTEPGEPLVLPDYPDNVSAVGEGVAACLGDTVEKITIDALERRSDALPWVKEGITLHADEPNCLFCGETIPPTRLDELKSGLSGSFQKMTENIEATRSEIAALRSKLVTYGEEVLTLIADALPSHRESVRATVEALREANRETVQTCDEWDTLVQDKLARAGEDMQAQLKKSDGGKITTLHDELAQLVLTNNKEVAEFSETKEAAKIKLRNHHLADAYDGYREAIARELETREAQEGAARLVTENAAQLSELKSKLKEHAPAAAALNALLRSYLGHGAITIAVTDDGYQICRNGSVIKKPLSEGEKTAIAFCYFITTLKAGGKKIDDLIVVVDDPISSLDARAMTYVFSMVKSKLASSAQLFVLTHNIEFMRANKVWLNSKYRPAEPAKKSAEFFFIEARVNEGGKKSSKLVSMPSLIAEYESEYHYLYCLVFDLVENKDGFNEFAYLMPNAIRKVLEIFLAFKVPGSSGLGDKINQVVSRFNDLDEGRVRAMEKLAQLESHSESVGDVMALSPFTLEQIREAAETLLDMIKVMDAPHRSDMDGLCRKALAA